MPPSLAPVVWALGTLAAIVGAVIVGMRWLRGQIREEFAAAVRGDDFRAIIQREVAAAFTGQAEIDSAWRRGMERDVGAIQKRQDEQAKSIVEAHRRIDKLMEAP